MPGFMNFVSLPMTTSKRRWQSVNRLNLVLVRSSTSHSSGATLNNFSSCACGGQQIRKSLRHLFRVLAIPLLITGLVFSHPLHVAQGAVPEPNQTIHVVVDPSRSGIEIREDFIGLSYEKEILTERRVLAPENQILRKLLANLGHGNLRIGAASVETVGWTRQARTPSTGNKTVTTDDLDRFYGFVKATGWNVVHAVNCRRSNPSVAADEAAYAASAGGNSIVAFEIGNEPDLGPFGPSDQYQMQDYVKDFRAFAAAIRARIPDARFVGPGATTFGRKDNLNFLTRGIDEWTVPFADVAGKDIVQLTHHIYVVGKPEYTEPEENYAATIPTLLSSASRDRYIGTLKKLAKAAEKNGIPYRINESNSCYDGGLDGVSNTFASAIWGADYLFTLASYGASGVNLQAGDSGIQIYTPIDTRESGRTKARPLYYALLLFRASGTGRLIRATADGAQNLEVSAYAVMAKNGSISVAIINREASKNVTVQLDVTRYFQTGRVLRLEAPSLSSTTNVTFGGASVNPDGSWSATSTESVSRKGRDFTIKVPSASAVVIKFDNNNPSF